MNPQQKLQNNNYRRIFHKNISDLISLITCTGAIYIDNLSCYDSHVICLRTPYDITKMHQI